MGDTSSSGTDHHTPLITRRRLLGGAASLAAVGGAGALAGGPLVRSITQAAPAAGPAGGTPYRVLRNPAVPAFHSRPDLLPPQMQITLLHSNPQDGYVLLTPSAVPGARGVVVATQIAEDLGQPGTMILTESGQLVWFQPTNGLATNLQVQSYRSKPVLTYWQGSIAAGMGFGKGYVLDSSYRTIAVVRGGNGVQADLHELQLTAENTALVTGYVRRAADLSAVGGPKRGSVWDSVVQEIDIATGHVLLDWRSLDHVPISETQASFARAPFDYFHVNSICPYGSNELLVSSRNTWALYRIDRRTGAVVARINGKASNYQMGPGTHFFWQHHARVHPGGIVTVFDDGAAPKEEARSRGLVLAVDDSARTVKLVKAFVHPANLLAQFEGSMQLMPDGGAFVGWGGVPYYSQFAADGSLELDGRFPTNDQSYRAFRSAWVGTPTTPPDIAVAKDALGTVALYVSWNGDTRTTSWQVLSGNSPASLRPIATLPKAGFETAITIEPEGKLLAVAALDPSGKRLGVSRAVSA